MNKSLMNKSISQQVKPITLQGSATLVVEFFSKQLMFVFGISRSANYLFNIALIIIRYMNNNFKPVIDYVARP